MTPFQARTLEVSHSWAWESKWSMCLSGRNGGHVDAWSWKAGEASSFIRSTRSWNFRVQESRSWGGDGAGMGRPIPKDAK